MAAGKQLVVRPVLEGFPNAHLWSIGATEGTQSIRLDTLDEGQTRLLACPPASPSRPGAPRTHSLRGGLAARKVGSVCRVRATHSQGRPCLHHVVRRLGWG